MRRLSWSLLLAAGVIAVAAVGYLWLRAAPEVARLLPECDAMVYVNLKPLRAATHFDRSPVTRSLSYQQFVDATGIVAERDLDSAAFALDRMADPSGPNGVVAFTEVFVGRFDHDRLTRYLHLVATTEDSYGGRVVYSVPSEGRTLRVALLDGGMVAASNEPTPEQIHSVLDKAQGVGWVRGSSLLAARYGDVPQLSSGWGIGKIGLPFSQDGRISLLGLELPLAAESQFVASVRYQGEVKVRVEELAGSEAEAGKATDGVTSIVGMFKALAMMQPKQDRVERELMDSVKIVQEKNRMVVTLAIPAESLKMLGK